MRPGTSLVWISIVCATSGCGGTTQAGTGQTQPGAGASAGSGGSGGSSVGAAGGSSGGAGSGGGGSSAAGAGGSAGSVAAVGAECAAPGDCLLETSDCCGFCGIPTTSNYDAVDWQAVAAHQADICKNGQSECPPHCAPGKNADLAAFCQPPPMCNSGGCQGLPGHCQVVQIHSDDISSCDSDADCEIRKSDCCDCGPTEVVDLVALNAQLNAYFEKQVCGPGSAGCAQNCAPQHPPGVGPVCNQTTRHCEVRDLPEDACPADLPSAMTACSAGTLAVCEYGSEVVIACRTQATCEGGLWVIQDPGCAPAPHPGEQGCPASMPPTGLACTMTSLVCDFGEEASCECLLCPSGECSPTGMGSWACGGPPGFGSGCPPVANTGQPCTSEGVTCSYGTSCSPTGTRRACQNGVWVQMSQACEG